MSFPSEYVAGLIDGDGSVSLTEYRQSGNVYLVVQLTGLDTPEFQALGGEIKRNAKRCGVTSAGNPYAKMCWYGSTAETLMREIGPHLRLKRRQWEITQRFFENRSLAPQLRVEMMRANKET